MNRAARRAEKFGKRNWQTRAIDPAGGLRVLERYVDSVTLLPEHKVNDVQLLALASLDAITKGHGTAEHIGAISLACNMTGALIRQGIGEEATEIVERCQTALLNADRRYTSWPLGFQRTGTAACSRPARRARAHGVERLTTRSSPRASGH